MAVSTWLASSDPDEQAEAAETSKPAASRASTSVSESTRGHMIDTTPGRRPSSTRAVVVGTTPVPSAQRRP